MGLEGSRPAVIVLYEGKNDLCSLFCTCIDKLNLIWIGAGENKSNQYDMMLL